MLAVRAVREVDSQEGCSPPHLHPALSHQAAAA